MVAMLADIFTFTTGRTQVIHPVERSTEMSQNRCYNDVSTFSAAVNQFFIIILNHCP
jgi:hypothetical protein